MSAEDVELTPEQFAMGKRVARWMVARWELEHESAQYDATKADLDARTERYNRDRAEFDAEALRVEAELKAGRGLIRNTRAAWKLTTHEDEVLNPAWAGLAAEYDRLNRWAWDFDRRLAALDAEQQTLTDLTQRPIEVPTARPDQAYAVVAQYGMADPVPVPVPVQQYGAPVYDYPSAAPMQQPAPQHAGADYGEPDYAAYAEQYEDEDYDEPEQYAPQPQPQQYAAQPDQPQPTAATRGGSLDDLF